HRARPRAPRLRADGRAGGGTGRPGRGDAAARGPAGRLMARLIAEVGSNHNRDLDRALRLLDACADAGCQAAKLQVFRVDDLFAPEVLAVRPDLRARRAWELPLELLDPIADRCRARGLALGATPFGLWAVEPLAARVDFLKVASYELLWHDLIRACAATGLPLVVSTGMAT